MRNLLKIIPLLALMICEGSQARGARSPKDDAIVITDPACHEKLLQAIHGAAYEMARSLTMDQLGRDRFTHTPSIYTTRSDKSSRALVVSKIDEDHCFYIWEVIGNFKKEACVIRQPAIVSELMSNGCL